MDNYTNKLHYYGVTHKSVVLSKRELFSLTENQIKIAYSFKENFNIQELFILTTCARTEFYAYCERTELLSFIQFIYEYFKKKCELNLLTYKNSEECIRQLMVVSCGIDSLLIGETQITSQIKKSFDLSKIENGSKSVLIRLIQASLETGKKVRNQTNLSNGSFSISYAAVEKICEVSEEINTKCILIVGAGITGKLVAQNFRKKGANNIHISNRCKERGRILADDVNANFINFKDYHKFLQKSDIVITCTTAPYNLITTKEVLSIMKSRESMLFMDLSVPRNIESSVERIPNVDVYSIDDINDVINKYVRIREKELPQAYKIINNLVKSFTHWLNQLKVVPTISNLKHYYESILEFELSKLKNKHDQKTLETINLFSKSLIKKIMKEPINFLKSDSTEEKTKINYVDLLRSVHKFK